MTAPEDSQKHILGKHCWCNPEVENFGAANILQHNREDE